MAEHSCPYCGNRFEIVVRSQAAPAHKAPPADGSIHKRLVRQSGGAVETDDIGELLDAITDDDQLDGKAAEFITQTRERYAKWKSNTKMSDKQMAWLKRIAAGEFRKDDWN